MVVMYFYLERDNDRVLEFHVKIFFCGLSTKTILNILQLFLFKAQLFVNDPWQYHEKILF